ncbi:hypothetical protein C8R44DRAFT_852903 [Mycena epipterygia]|nr:hypothetical protein C8R44DRAFT_852903 [Mycena epipterygia]
MKWRWSHACLFGVSFQVCLGLISFRTPNLVTIVTLQYRLSRESATDFSIQREQLISSIAKLLRERMATQVLRLAPKKTTPPRPSPVTPPASRSDFTADTPMLVQSPPALSPELSTNFALAAQHHPAALVPGPGGIAPSLVPSNDSGYTASSESALIATPSPMPTPQGGTALNSSRYEDNFSTGGVAPPVPDKKRLSSASQSEGPRAPENSAASAFVADAMPNTQGSAALNSRQHDGYGT